MGDTFHILPFLKQACKKYQVHWVHSTYATRAVMFIRDHIKGMDITSVTLPATRDFPLGLPDVQDFWNRYKDQFAHDQYDLVLPESMGQVEQLVCPNIINTQFTLGDVSFDRMTDSIVELNHDVWQLDRAVTQFTTVSGWKLIDALYALGTSTFNPLEVIAVGAKGERTMVGAKKILGEPFDVVADYIKSSRFVITLHSASACLAYHLGVPMICVSFADKNLYKFQHRRPNVVELIRPDLKTLECTIRDYIDNPREHLTAEDLK